MSATNDLNDDATLPEDSVVQRLDRARGRIKDAAKEAAAKAQDAAHRAQERLAPTLERTQEVAANTGRQLQTAGQDAVGMVRRNPWKTAAIVAGVGVGLFLALRTPARGRALGLGAELLRRYGAQEELDRMGRRLRDIDLSRVESQARRFGDQLSHRARDFGGRARDLDLRSLSERVVRELRDMRR